MRHKIQDSSNNYGSAVYNVPQWSPYSSNNQEKINMDIKEKNYLIIKQDLLIQQQKNILKNGDLLCYNLLGSKTPIEYKQQEKYYHHNHQQQQQKNKPYAGYFMPIENNMIPQIGLNSNENIGGFKDNISNYYSFSSSSPPLPPPPQEVKKLIKKEVATTSLLSSSMVQQQQQQNQKEELLIEKQISFSPRRDDAVLCTSTPSLSTESSSTMITSSSSSSSSSSPDNEVAEICEKGKKDENNVDGDVDVNVDVDERRVKDKNVEKSEKDKKNNCEEISQTRLK